MDISKLLTSEKTAERLGINRQSLYNLVSNDPDFPTPVKVGRTSLWDPEKVDAWRKRHPERKKKRAS